MTRGDISLVALSPTGFTTTLPVPKRQNPFWILFLNFGFTADGNVANRFFTLQLKLASSPNFFLSVGNSAMKITAGLFAEVSFFPGANELTTILLGLPMTTALPNDGYFVPADMSAQIVVTNAQVGDAFSNGFALIQEAIL
jgi:hypothetical protein